ncbi:hypothetical protein BJ878DRAFT_430021, partial [Calycina marina]
LVSWISDEQGNQIVIESVIGGFGIAFKPEGGYLLQTRYAIGNGMWQSPEGQTVRGVAQALDVFSFGLVVSSVPCASPRTHAKSCLQRITLGARNLVVLKDY